MSIIGLVVSLADQLTARLRNLPVSFDDAQASLALWRQLDSAMETVQGAIPAELASSLLGVAAVVASRGTARAATAVSTLRRDREALAAFSFYILLLEVAQALLTLAKQGRLVLGEADTLRLLSAAAVGLKAGPVLLRTAVHPRSGSAAWRKTAAPAPSLRLLLLGSCGVFSEYLKVVLSTIRPLPPRLLAALQASSLQPAEVVGFLEAASVVAEKLAALEGPKALDCYFFEAMSNGVRLEHLAPAQQLLADTPALRARLAALAAAAFGARAKLPSQERRLGEWAETQYLTVSVLGAACLEGGRRQLAASAAGRQLLVAAVRIFKVVPLAAPAGQGSKVALVLARLHLGISALVALLLDDLVAPNRASNLATAAAAPPLPDGLAAAPRSLYGALELQRLASAAKQLLRLLGLVAPPPAAAGAGGLGELMRLQLNGDLRDTLMAWAALCNNLCMSLLLSLKLDLSTPEACSAAVAAAEALLRLEPLLAEGGSGGGGPQFGPVRGRGLVAEHPLLAATRNSAAASLSLNSVRLAAVLLAAISHESALGVAADAAPLLLDAATTAGKHVWVLAAAGSNGGSSSGGAAASLHQRQAAACKALHLATLWAAVAGKKALDQGGSGGEAQELLRKRLEALALMYLDVLPTVRRMRADGGTSHSDAAILDPAPAFSSHQQQLEALAAQFELTHLAGVLLAPAPLQQQAQAVAAGGRSRDGGSALRQTVVDMAEALRSGRESAASCQYLCWVAFDRTEQALGQVRGLLPDTAADEPFLYAMAAAGEALAGWLSDPLACSQLEEWVKQDYLLHLIQAVVASLAAEMQDQQLGSPSARELLQLVMAGPVGLPALRSRLLPLFRAAIGESQATLRVRRQAADDLAALAGGGGGSGNGQQQAVAAAAGGGKQQAGGEQRAVRRTRALSTRTCSNLRCTNLGDVSEAKMAGPLVCAGCRVARYCSRQCAAADWPTHKPACQLLQGVASAAVAQKQQQG